MYCKNCGAQFQTDDALVCTNCGVQKGIGDKYCWNCGEEVQENAQICTRCGVALNGTPRKGLAPGQKSKLVAGLLGIFLGTFGVHNFYLGYNKKAVIQLVCSLVGFATSCLVVGVFVVAGIGIWGLIEGIMILTGNIAVDGAGNLLGE